MDILIFVGDPIKKFKTTNKYVIRYLIGRIHKSLRCLIFAFSSIVYDASNSAALPRGAKTGFWKHKKKYLYGCKMQVDTIFKDNISIMKS